MLSVIAITLASLILGEPGAESSDHALLVKLWIFGGIAIIIAIVGGIYALRRRIWGLALAGSICALVGFGIPGILAIIFVTKGKREFK